MQAPGPVTGADIPGISSAFRYEVAGELQDEYSFTITTGYCDPTSVPPVVMDSDMLFEIGSITKSFTAAAVLKYLETSFTTKVASPTTLDTTIQQAVPYIASDRIPGVATIEQLLNLTAGIADLNLGPIPSLQGYHGAAANDSSPQRNSDEVGPQPYSSTKHFWLQNQVYAGLALPKPLGAWNYSSTAYVVLGQYLQFACNNVNIKAAYRHQIWDPLHFEHTYLGGFEPVPQSELAIGWSQDGYPSTGASRVAFFTGYWSAGAIISRIDEVARFAQAFWNPDITILTPYFYKKMLNFVSFPNEYETLGISVPGVSWNGYGLGTKRVIVDLGWNKKVQLIGHDGSSGSCASTAYYLADRKASFAFTFNRALFRETGHTLCNLQKEITRTLMAYDKPNG